MKSSVNLVLVSLVALLLASSIAHLNVSASCLWTGNDNGEWDISSSCQGCKITNGHVYAQSSLSSTMSYSSSDGYVSLQYNQDWDTDKNYQPAPYSWGGTDWVQLVVDGASSNNCLGLAIEVINQLYGWNDYFWQYNNSLCGAGNFNGIFSSGAYWQIWADTDSSGKIKEVEYTIQGGGSGGQGIYYDQFPPVNCTGLDLRFAGAAVTTENMQHSERIPMVTSTTDLMLICIHGCHHLI